MREMLIDCREALRRRGGHPLGPPAGVPDGQRRRLHRRGALTNARSLGLKPVTTSVRCLPSNGMAQSFVNTFKRDYVSRMDLADAKTVMAQLPKAFEHFNNVHPHSSLRMRSPREFRQLQQRVAQTGSASTSA